MRQTADVAIIGSGFAGSILAWILARQGLCVALVDSARHPRFAIGESSTPIADLLLRRLGQRYEIQSLESLSSWGAWQRTHRQLACGRKRGFSYFSHTPGQRFTETRPGEKSLLVAASSSDDVADTHWYRADVDQFFFQGAIDAGAIDLTGHEVVAHDRTGNRRTLTCVGRSRLEVASDWVIDASGKAGILARLSGAVDRSDQLRTNTRSMFGHFSGVASWTEHLRSLGLPTDDDPFDPDDAAQHHLVDGGWLWMLRFNNNITSVGFTTQNIGTFESRDFEWSDYQSIDALMRSARLVAPDGGLCRSGRLQRLYDPVIDERQLLMPTAAVTIDPLHSTGIAHGLAGVERLAEIILPSGDERRAELIAQYRRSVLDEARLLDRLVSTAYATMDDFPRFTTACMLYFAGAVCCEEAFQRGQVPTHLWSADDPAYVGLVDQACDWLVDPKHECFDAIRERLQPWNTAGLMDPDVAGRYAYTATKNA